MAVGISSSGLYYTDKIKKQSVLITQPTSPAPKTSPTGQTYIDDKQKQQSVLINPAPNQPTSSIRRGSGGRYSPPSAPEPTPQPTSPAPQPTTPVPSDKNINYTNIETSASTTPGVDQNIIMTGVYTPSSVQLRGESSSSYEQRVQKEVNWFASQEAKKQANKRQGSNVEVRLSYEYDLKEPETKKTEKGFMFLEPKDNLKKESKRTFFKDDRAEGVDQKVFLGVAKIVEPSKFKDMTKDEFQTEYSGRLFGKIQDKGEKVSSWFKSLPDRAEGVMNTKGFEFGALQEKRMLSSTPFIGGLFKKEETEIPYGSGMSKDVVVGGAQLESRKQLIGAGVKTLSVAGDVFIGQTLQQPIQTILTFGAGKKVGVLARSFNMKYAYNISEKIKNTSVPVRSFIKGVGIGLKSSVVGAMTSLGLIDVVTSSDPATRSVQYLKEGALFSLGYSSGRYPTISLSTPRNQLGDKWRLNDRTSIVNKETGTELIITKGDSTKPQTTLSGNRISTGDIYTARSEVGLDPLKKSPLGIDDYYKNTNVPLVKGSSNRLDESIGYVNYAKTESGGAVLSDVGSVGPRTKPFFDDRVKISDMFSAKEFSVPARNVEQVLSSNPFFKVQGRTPTQGVSSPKQDFLTVTKRETQLELWDVKEKYVPDSLPNLPSRNKVSVSSKTDKTNLVFGGSDPLSAVAININKPSSSVSFGSFTPKTSSFTSASPTTSPSTSPSTSFASPSVSSSSKPSLFIVPSVVSKSLTGSSRSNDVFSSQEQKRSSGVSRKGMSAFSSSFISNVENKQIIKPIDGFNIKSKPIQRVGTDSASSYKQKIVTDQETIIITSMGGGSSSGGGGSSSSSGLSLNFGGSSSSRLRSRGRNPFFSGALKTGGAGRDFLNNKVITLKTGSSSVDSVRVKEKKKKSLFSF